MDIDEAVLTRAMESEAYVKLVAQRSRFAWTLTAIMIVTYFGFIGLIAFDKEVLARPIGTGVTSIGIPVGLGLILLTILLTGIYVVRANREFDSLTARVREELGQ